MVSEAKANLEYPFDIWYSYNNANESSWSISKYWNNKTTIKIQVVHGKTSLLNMEDNFQIGIIIATAFQRTELLFDRSLKSVLNQSYSPAFIVIVDDNREEKEFEIIVEKVNKLNHPNVHCIRNYKTKHISGTGAWNSGVGFLISKFDDLNSSYVAILDDDDEWDLMYLEKCAIEIRTRGVETTKAVFANLERIHKNFKVYSDLSHGNITVDNFLIGNPGVQGSNTFLHLSAFLEMGGFDEGLQSCTDRDMMIQFLKRNATDKVAIIKETLVHHYAQSETTVSSMHSSQWAGLDSFYRKYINYYSKSSIEKSLLRAEKYFSYPNRDQIESLYKNRQKIVLAMPMQNASKTIRNAVLSFINQKQVHRKLMLVIGNDNSTDDWYQQIHDLLTDDIIIINITDGGKSYKVRNAINDYIMENVTNVAYIGRLDADDELADELVITKLEQIIATQNPDVIFAGNYQRKNNEIVGTNLPNTNFFNHDYMLERLQQMCAGNLRAELPSCNTFVKPGSLIKYPTKESAEDHWFSVELLLKSDVLNIHIADDFVYSTYSLFGDLTCSNLNSNSHLHSRSELYEYYKSNTDGQKK
jgi:glycosyltransferase involved in cell wall biosynthesis